MAATAATNKNRNPRLIALFGDCGRYAGVIHKTRTHEIFFHPYSLDDYLPPTTAGGEYSVDKEKLRLTAEAVFSGNFDACFCDSGDALLLQYYAEKKGFPPLPFFINEVDGFETARRIGAFIANNYGDDFFPKFISSPLNNWMYILKSRRPAYLALHIPPSRLFYVPMSTAGIEFFFPRFFRRPRKAGHEALALNNKIIAAGSHDRDFAILAKAVRETSLEVHIITDFRLHRPFHAPGVTWHDSMPEADYFTALKNAKAVVIPLLGGGRAAGQMACVTPMKMGRPVITARCDATADHVTHLKTGFLYEPGLAESLSDALLQATGNPELLERIAINAKLREEKLSSAAAASLAKLLHGIPTT